MIRQILGALNQYERSMIRLRLRSGRRRKAERGGFAYGGPPYGWAAQNRELVPIDTEQTALARIRQLRRDGVSLRQIAATLETEGHQPRRGNRWHPQVLVQILERDASRLAG